MLFETCKHEPRCDVVISNNLNEEIKRLYDNNLIANAYDDLDFSELMKYVFNYYYYNEINGIINDN